ncbi:MAG: penicillin-binding protein 2 [Planctomycetota bacterium]|nr:penicillin-binding protein 2 [Planctomycetota bacterium]
MRAGSVALEHRLRVTFAILFLALMALLVRAGYLQIFKSRQISERARNQHLDRVEIDAPRGRILDRNGRILTASFRGVTVAVNPQRVSDPERFASAVAFTLKETDAASEFAEGLAAMKRAGKRYYLLRRGVDRDLAARLRAARLDGLDLREEGRRVHPHGRAGIQLLGLYGGDGDPRKRRGLSGLEAWFEQRLRGQPGQKPVVMLLRRTEDGIRRERHVLEPDRARAPTPGTDVRTTIDLTLQQIVEEALDDLQARFLPVRSCAIAMDPRSGEILALAGRPALDPTRVPNVPRESLKVQAVEWCYEPGSTIKPLIMAAALAEGAVRPGQEIDCGPGYRQFGWRRVHDVRPNGVLSLEDVLVKSSNIGMAQVSLALGSPRAHAFLTRLGFGRKTGISMPGESAGRLFPLDRWRDNDILLSVGFGYAVSVTPVQLVRAYSALVNGGLLYPPTLVRGATSAPPVELDLSRFEREFVRDAMVRVVAEGTGRRARVPGMRVGGKTGTTKKYPLESNRYVASFIAFAPADDPQIVLLVAADEPKRKGNTPYGGYVAAPYVGQILRRAKPLLDAQRKETLTKSGVRHQKIQAELVRVAAVR